VLNNAFEEIEEKEMMWLEVAEIIESAEADA